MNRRNFTLFHFRDLLEQSLATLRRAFDFQLHHTYKHMIAQLCNHPDITQSVARHLSK